MTLNVTLKIKYKSNPEDINELTRNLEKSIEHCINNDIYTENTNAEIITYNTKISEEK